MSDDTSGRLARWSQRKHAARQERRGEAATAEPDDARVPGTATTNPIVPAEQSPPADAVDAMKDGAKENVDQASGDKRPPLPSLEELDANSDYTGFLGKDVPEALTRAALRKLWLSDPVFANLDGLNDYDLDYNVVDKVITAAQSSYQVGRGYVDDASPENKDGETRETKKEDEVAARTGKDGSESREPAAGRTAENEDNKIEQIEAANTSPRPVASAEPDRTDVAGDAKSGEADDKSHVSDG